MELINELNYDICKIIEDKKIEPLYSEFLTFLKHLLPKTTVSEIIF